MNTETTTPAPLTDVSPPAESPPPSAPTVAPIVAATAPAEQVADPLAAAQQLVDDTRAQGDALIAEARANLDRAIAEREARGRDAAAQAAEQANDTAHQLATLLAKAEAREEAHTLSARLEHVAALGLKPGLYSRDDLTQLLPKVDPSTPEGAKALLAWKQERPALFESRLPSMAEQLEAAQAAVTADDANDHPVYGKAYRAKAVAAYFESVAKGGGRGSVH